MENQIKTVVCPNCGANATNLQNCEYCNSILVRCYAAQANGVNFEIEELKATLNTCDPERKIENALQKIYDKCPAHNEGFIDINYGDDEECFTQLLCGCSGFEMNVGIRGSSEYNQTQLKIIKLAKELGFELNRDCATCCFGFDMRTMAQVIYLMVSWYYGEYKPEKITYTLVDILETDVRLDSDGEELKSSAQQNTDKSSNSGCLGVIAAIIGISIASLCALLLPIIL